ncbi:hypothetical protein [Corynebacterium renale]|uniref:hypothetical protein n=1 Tax=Corynebacterium renale TaxID=1724 RepID=UPI000DF964D6|nr:hypothetical protein [Corynebacterium renale]STC94617.1 beta-N-acetylhexosaminidase [Corynebacterium renale]
MACSTCVRLIVSVAATVFATSALVACGSGQETPAPSTEASTEVSSTVETSSDATTTSSSTASATETTTKKDDGVAQVAETFSTLAPKSLFAQFDSCNPNGLENSMECSGSEIGQFQFFDTESKAASTAQLLTELRSSRVVLDTGSHIIGWTTLGNNAVVTVVDTHKAQVMQQMISSDKVDPEERIKKLGLVEHVEKHFSSGESDESSEEKETESASATPTSSPARS